MRRRGARAGRWRRRFRPGCGSRSTARCVDLEVHARARRQLSACAPATTSVSFETRRLRQRHELRFRAGGLVESATFLRDGDRLYVQRLGVTIAVRDLTRAAPARAAASGGDGKAARGDERPRRRGAGQGRRPRRGRPAGADAGSDEDGARARRADFGHRCPRSTSPRASRSPPAGSSSRSRRSRSAPKRKPCRRSDPAGQELGSEHE